MPTLEDAIALAAEAHASQTDKAGMPCGLHLVLHLLRMMQAQGPAETLYHVTKPDGDSYANFAKWAGRHRVARQVKTADLEDNMDVTRLDSVGEEDAERLDRYLRAYRQLAGRKEAS